MEVFILNPTLFFQTVDLKKKKLGVNYCYLTDSLSDGMSVIDSQSVGGCVVAQGASRKAYPDHLLLNLGSQVSDPCRLVTIWTVGRFC